MEKLNLNNLVFVIKAYEYANPQVVERFPATEQGINDAYTYCSIMNRNSNNQYAVVSLIKNQ